MDTQVIQSRYIQILLVLLCATPVVAHVHLPAIFSDHMVLQRNAEVSFWGIAKAGEEVEIKPGWTDEIYSMTAPPSGNWSIMIPTPCAGGPFDIHIKGWNEQVLTDVLIGEVWLVSGQSNMEWTPRMGIDNAEEEVAAADYPEIRFFSTAHAAAPDPQIHLIGQWEASSPKTMMDFSAVAYFFGRELHLNLDVPVGLINSSWGGTPAETWTPGEFIQADPALVTAAAKLNEVPWGPVRTGLLYNAMIAPLVPFRIQGVLWYQGEANVGHADTYDKTMEALISGWRQKWGYPFPFYFAQIAPYNYGGFDTGAALRDAQRRSLAIPHTKMVVTSDIGNIKNIHPRNKQDVGKRFANLAFRHVYGTMDAVVSGPLYQQVEQEGSSLRVHFSNTGCGLVSRDGPLTHFEVCGLDGVFHPAQARIDGITVVVSSQQVEAPVSVRFAWDDMATPNLFNSEGLPASTFQSDPIKTP